MAVGWMALEQQLKEPTMNELPDHERFWMVYRPGREGHPPRKRYKSMALAAADARELSKLNHGAKFFVLEAIGVMHVPAVEEESAKETVAAVANAVDKPF